LFLLSFFPCYFFPLPFSRHLSFILFLLFLLDLPFLFLPFFYFSFYSSFPHLHSSSYVIPPPLRPLSMTAVRFPARGEIFLFYTASRPALGPTQSPIQWVQEALSPGVKQLGREADRWPPSSAEVKNVRDIPPLPHTSSWHNA
jgi:hypothetical protein